MLIDEKLPAIYGCVQAGHAVAKFLLDNKNQTWNNQYLIYVKADLDRWIPKLDLLGKQYSVFNEPDLDMHPTALAIQDDSKLFSKLKLIG